MSKIRSKNTLLEKKLEEILKKTGEHYEKQYNLFGKPDFVFLEQKVAVFADSHFWHGYNWKELKQTIKTNQDFWIKKIKRNMERDIEVNNKLQMLGWKVIRFWENEILQNPNDCYTRISQILKSTGE